MSTRQVYPAPVLTRETGGKCEGCGKGTETEPMRLKFVYVSDGLHKLCDWCRELITQQ